jgi:hypothetical protein
MSRFSRFSRFSTRYHPYSHETLHHPYSHETLQHPYLDVTVNIKVENFYKNFLQSLKQEIKELRRILMEIPINEDLGIKDILLSITDIEKIFNTIEIIISKLKNFNNTKKKEVKLKEIIKIIEEKITEITKKFKIDPSLDSSKDLDPLLIVEKKNLNILLNELFEKILYILSLQDNVQDNVQERKVLLFMIIIYKLKELKSKISIRDKTRKRTEKDILKEFELIKINYGMVANIREFYIQAYRNVDDDILSLANKLNGLPIPISTEGLAEEVILMIYQNLIFQHYAFFLFKYLRYDNEKYTGIPAFPQLFKNSSDFDKAEPKSSNSIDAIFKEQKTVMSSLDKNYEKLYEEKLRHIAHLTGGRRRNTSKRNMDMDMNMKDIKELCKKNQIKLSRVVNDKRVVYKKKELITKLKRRKVI